MAATGIPSQSPRPPFVTHDPLGNPIDKKHPWNQTTIPKPRRRDFNGNYTWVMSPRWFDKRTGDHLALDTGGGPIARLWVTALANLVDIGYVKATGHVQELIVEIDTLPDSNVRELLQECMQEVLAFYGLGLDRVLEVARSVTGNQNAYDKLVNDSVVRGLLLIHGLHPVPLETRLYELEKVRPYMESHGGNVELLSLENDAARLRLVGHCKSCPSSAVTLELALRQAIEEACPDLISFECEGVAEAPANHESHLPNAAPSWTVVDGVQGLADGGLLSIHAAGVPLVLCKTAGQLYAYRDRCPACNMPLHLGTLDRTLLSCRAGHRYDVQHAGRAVDSADLHLDPFPLLVSDDTVKVALPADRGSAAPHNVPTTKEEPAPAG